MKSPGIKVFKVRNRLDTGNRDFLINFIFKECKLHCEVQVGIRNRDDQKGTYLSYFSHFLYELNRTKFGCLTESAIIIANQLDIGTHFKK
jgi:hypothetical protein